MTDKNKKPAACPTLSMTKVERLDHLAYTIKQFEECARVAISDQNKERYLERYRRSAALQLAWVEKEKETKEEGQNDTHDK